MLHVGEEPGTNTEDRPAANPNLLLIAPSERGQPVRSPLSSQPATHPCVFSASCTDGLLNMRA